MATLHGLFCEGCCLPWLNQCWSGLTMGFKGLNSSAICSSCKSFLNIRAFSYSMRVLLTVSCSRLCGWHHGPFSMSYSQVVHIFTVVFCGCLQVPLTYSVISASPSSYLGLPSQVCIYPQAFACPAENSAALPCTSYYLASWDTSASALANLGMKLVFLLKAGWFMFPDIHTVHYEDFHVFASRLFFTM